MERLWAPWRMTYITAGDMGAGCPFCIAETVPDRERLILFRDDAAMVLMNLYPYTNAHLLVMPRSHIGELALLEAALYARVALLLRATAKLLERELRCQGMNLGMNLGRCAGAGVDAHVHWHAVPRWGGDTNFMPVLGDVRVMSQHLEDTYDELKPVFSTLAWNGTDYESVTMRGP